jgi:hypothetical protein
MKKDELEQIVDDYLKQISFLTRHDLKLLDWMGT